MQGNKAGIGLTVRKKIFATFNIAVGATLCGRPPGANIINVGDKRTTLKQAVGNGLDRSAGTMSCNVGNNPTTERSRPFPTYSIGRVRGVLRKDPERHRCHPPPHRCHPERSEGSCAGDHIGSPLRQRYKPPQIILPNKTFFS